MAPRDGSAKPTRPTRLYVGRNRTGGDGDSDNYIIATALVAIESVRPGGSYVYWRLPDVDTGKLMTMSVNTWALFGFPELKPGESAVIEFTARRVPKTKEKKKRAGATRLDTLPRPVKSC